jgi:hypothetical protein
MTAGDFAIRGIIGGLEAVSESESSLGRLFPPSKGVAAPYKQMFRYLRKGAAGEVTRLSRHWFDLPGRAESKVALR